MWLNVRGVRGHLSPCSLVSFLFECFAPHWPLCSLFCLVSPHRFQCPQLPEHNKLVFKPSCVWLMCPSIPTWPPSPPSPPWPLSPHPLPTPIFMATRFYKLQQEWKSNEKSVNPSPLILTHLLICGKLLTNQHVCWSPCHQGLIVMMKCRRKPFSQFSSPCTDHTAAPLSPHVTVAN